MKMFELKCPSCGATLNVAEEQRQLYCQYCGTKIIVDDGVRRTEIKHVIRDEARLKEAEAYENVELAEIELEREWQDNRRRSMKRWGRICLILFLLSAISLLLGYVIIKPDDMDALLFDSPFGAVALISLAFFEIVLIYGAIGYFISMLSHNSTRKRRFKRK